MNEQEKKQAVFTHLGSTLARFNDPAKIGLTVEVFAKYAPDYFWEMPASSSGRHHPPAARGRGGLVWHVLHAIEWGVSLAERIESDPGYAELRSQFPCMRDDILQALLLHDLWKFGRRLRQYENGSWARPEHGVTATHGGDLADHFLRNTRLLDCVPETVRLAIGAHMGPWTDPKYRYWADRETYPLATRLVVETVQLADYCSSRHFGDNA